MTENDPMIRLATLLREADTAMLTTVSTDGKLISRPMTTQDTDFLGDLWFVFSKESPQASQIQKAAEVNVAFETKNTWVSISGSGHIVEDRIKLEEHWTSAMDAWFPHGIDSPEVALLRVEVESAQYWETKAGPLTAVIEKIKARGSDEQPDIGQSQKVEF
ncbi:pyridoxamine 5'-phosphate oxidase family protein [Arthrobacter rhombi]|uniref:pyridoxamine 5'-phosphate oxidase family protein n=1 Tax=Arthrobacter rhombi TaxID=71253 RepID=UPI0031DCD225